MRLIYCKLKCIRAYQRVSEHERAQYFPDNFCLFSQLWVIWLYYFWFSWIFTLNMNLENVVHTFSQFLSSRVVNVVLGSMYYIREWFLLCKYTKNMLCICNWIISFHSLCFFFVLPHQNSVYRKLTEIPYEILFCLKKLWTHNIHIWPYYEFL